MIATVLINGLWQGALIAIAAWIIVRCVPTRDATTRYALWFAALLALLVIPIVTTALHFESRLGVPGNFMFSLAAANSVTSDATRLLRPLALSLTPTVITWTSVVWIVGALVQLSKLVASFLRIGRIRAGAIPLAAQGTPDVFASADVEIPIAAGLFAPAIFIPNGLVESLGTQDLERIIEHERAHLRRHDIVGNAVQRAIEALLWFSPWVAFIGHQLVMERETACDDWVVQCTGEADEYATCLATVAQSVGTPRALLVAPSAFGSHHALLVRIEHVLNGEPRSSLTLNYYAFGGTLVIFAILTFALQMFSPVLAYAPSMTSAPPSSVRTFVPVTVVACKNQSKDAQVTDAAAPSFPASVSKLKGPVTATVRVRIAASGKLTNSKILHSSGVPAIDRAALDTARRSTYSPAIKDCKPVAGTYLFRIDFNAPG